MQPRSNSGRRRGNLAPVMTVLTSTSRRQDFTLGHSTSAYFSFFPPALFFPSYLLWNALKLQRVPSPRTMCSQARQQRMPIQMKSVLQLLQSWDHFTWFWQIFFFLKKATIKVSHLVSFQWKGFESGKNTKQLIIICCSESLVCEFCFLLPVSTEHTRPKRNIRSTWNSVPNLQTSYHDCTCKLVR